MQDIDDIVTEILKNKAKCKTITIYLDKRCL